MNLNSIINDIENLDNSIDRCISYCEVIIFLKTLKTWYPVIEGAEDDLTWKQIIANKLVEVIGKDIDASIDKIKDMIKANIEYNKLL